jgi:hypothetical protein
MALPSVIQTSLGQVGMMIWSGAGPSTERRSIMSLKDEYIGKLKQQLDQWNIDIDVLEARAREADDEFRANCNAYLEALKARRDEARVRLTLLRSSAGDAWQELRKGSDEAWDSIRHALSEARKKFGE